MISSVRVFYGLGQDRASLTPTCLADAQPTMITVSQRFAISDTTIVGGEGRIIF
jgi:hypothetical protein